MNKPELILLPDEYAVCQYTSSDSFPPVQFNSGILSITWTDEECSIVQKAVNAANSQKVEAGWRCLKIKGVLDFSLVGILAGISSVLADAKVSLFAISTYNTDYILVKADQLTEARRALQSAGYPVVEQDEKD